MTWSLRLWHSEHTTRISLSIMLYNEDVQKNGNVLHPSTLQTPPASPSPSLPMYRLIPSDEWNGSSAKLCTMGIYTFLFSHKITACCSILCYGRCVPMGWLVEQRMGESKPARSSKVLHAFEDMHLLQAKVGWVEEMCTPIYTHTHSKMITKTFDQFDPQPAVWRHAHAIKEVLEREQIVCTLKV